ncbi:MAG: GerMN domain-containing protein [Candidatus Krumholzibacteriia bacterium]
MTAGGDRRTPVRGARLWLALAAVAALVVLGAVALRLVRQWREAAQAPAPEAAASDTTAATPGTRSVQLVFVSADALSPIIEQREIPAGNRLEAELRAALDALCDGPQTRGAVAPIPSGARPLGVFYDERQGAVLVDFSRELRDNHPGGSAAELATVDAILRTIALNFPEVRACTLLVGGEQIETLAGHVALDRPLDPRRWL